MTRLCSKNISKIVLPTLCMTVHYTPIQHNFSTVNKCKLDTMLIRKCQGSVVIA